MSEFSYVGEELELFADVHNWKAYWSSQVRPLLKGDVLEVGAGIGSNTSFLDVGGGTGRWVCLEPDANLAGQLEASLKKAMGRRTYETVCGTLESLADRQFDSIVYIDVLEHIEDDRAELGRAASLLRPGGRVIVLSPAHQRLFSPFDAAIGHFRRYDRRMMQALSPPGLDLDRIRYLDSAGLILSASNMMFLRQSMPTRAQLQFWDRCVVPVSRILDKLLSYSVGKTIVGVWHRTKP
jgi:SAM-dependent methyltransferase